MYAEGEPFHPPSTDSTRIWRYMDFTKFVSLLSRSQLFFSRPDLLGDEWEGAYTQNNVSQDIDVLKRELPHLSTLAGQELLEEVNRWESIRHYFYHEKRLRVYVNCWHMSEVESAAMWKLYLKSEEGIAVQSTFGRLRDSLENDPEVVFIGRVSYIDYSTESFPQNSVFSPLLHKRKSFEHERELRAISDPLDNYPGYAVLKPGWYHEVDLDVLVERVYVAPGAPGWFKELVESVLAQYKLGHKAVITSSLDERPIF